MISGKKLSRIEAHGKNLFYFFGSLAVLHIHFGMSGAFTTFDSQLAPPPKDTTRLLLDDGSICAHLSAMTTNIEDSSFYKTRIQTLGEDPLRVDANKEALWSKVQASKKNIGQILMDQTMIAGVGNIYRAEILFKAGVHPDVLGKDLPYADFLQVWAQSVYLLQKGFREGRIVTVEEPTFDNRRMFVYGQKRCARCLSPISKWEVQTRTLYCCETCQKKNFQEIEPTLSPAILTIQADNSSILTMTINELRSALKEKGLKASGSKKELISRLSDAMQASYVNPGIHASEMRSSEAALEEKRVAGEKLNLEHTAYADKRVDALNAEVIPLTPVAIDSGDRKIKRTRDAGFTATKAGADVKETTASTVSSVVAAKNKLPAKVKRVKPSLP